MLTCCSLSFLIKKYIIFRQIWICGEVLTSFLRDRAEKIIPWVKIFNFYSVSECHDVTCAGKYYVFL